MDRTLVSLAFAVFVAGCSSAPSTVDGGNTDAAIPIDANSTVDAPHATDDANVPAIDTGACPARPTDLSQIDGDCAGSDCPMGYTCQSFSGAVLTQSCQILCDPGGCPCPATTTCTMHEDKRGMPWHQCDPNP